LIVLGGSGTSTPELFDALANWPGGIDRRPPLDVVLVGRTADKLAAVESVCRALIGKGPYLAVSSQSDRRHALEGADVVLNQVRIGGYAARAFDESFPWQVGLPGEETMGPGGFANAIRTVPALRPIWDDVVAKAPGALVINLTNPAGIVQAAALAEYPDLRVVSVCDSPMPMLERIAERLNRSRDQVWSRYVGMNHLGWYVPESSDGPGILEALADLAVGNDPVDVGLQEAVPSPYVRYYLHPDRILADQRGKPTRARHLQDLEAQFLAAYRTKSGAGHAQRGAIIWYRMAVLGLLDAWIHGASDVPVLAGVRNGRRVPELPPDVVLELPHRAFGPGDLRPADPVPLPPLPLALLQAHASYESLTVRALVSGGDGEGTLRALLANPMVRNADQAAELWNLIEAGIASAGECAASVHDAMCHREVTLAAGAAGSAHLSASLSCADFGALPTQLRSLDRAGVRCAHLDFGDGRFVANFPLGLEVFSQLPPRTLWTRECHLMVADPLRVLHLFTPHADTIIFHVEAAGDPIACIAALRAAGVGVGIAVNPQTPPDAVIALLADVDQVLVMAVEPGFSGAQFLPDTFTKIRRMRALAERVNPRLVIAVDGAVNRGNIPALAQAGANRFCGGTSGLFVARDLEESARAFVACVEDAVRGAPNGYRQTEEQLG
jgi:6-phospho-beta-glucosidase